MRSVWAQKCQAELLTVIYCPLVYDSLLSDYYLILHSHQKVSCLKSGVEFGMNDIFYEFKYLHHFEGSLTFGVNVVLSYYWRLATAQNLLWLQISKFDFQMIVTGWWTSSNNTSFGCKRKTRTFRMEWKRPPPPPPPPSLDDTSELTLSGKMPGRIITDNNVVSSGWRSSKKV